jgi:hypothetical protein
MNRNPGARRRTDGYQQRWIEGTCYTFSAKERVLFDAPLRETLMVMKAGRCVTIIGSIPK